MKPKLLLVDDDNEIRTQMKWALGTEHDILTAENGEEALALFKAHRPQLTLLDLGLPPRPNDPEEGMNALAGILAFDQNAKVVVITGQGEKGNALEAIGTGAWDFLSKP